MRVIDTATGEIMASAKGEGESKRTGLMLGGGGAGGGGGGFGGVSMGSSDFRETILGEATEAAVKMVVEKLVAAKSRIANPVSRVALARDDRGYVAPPFRGTRGPGALPFCSRHL